jgi:hypothetical protein
LCAREIVFRHPASKNIFAPPLNRQGRITKYPISPKIHPMTRTPSPRADGALTLDDLRALGIRPEDVDEQWMDEMVKRLFHELRRQLSQLETAKAIKDTPVEAGRRATNVRTLVSLERTLERLARLEQQRALARETKVAAGNDDAVAALERRLDQLLAADGAPPISEKPQP